MVKPYVNGKAVCIHICTRKCEQILYENSDCGVKIGTLCAGVSRVATTQRMATVLIGSLPVQVELTALGEDSLLFDDGELTGVPFDDTGLHRWWPAATMLVGLVADGTLFVLTDEGSLIARR